MINAITYATSKTDHCAAAHARSVCCICMTLRKGAHTLAMPAAIKILLAVSILATPSVHAADRMQTGKWEFAMTIDGQTRNATMCVTPEEAASANGDTKSARASAERASKGGCEFKAYDVTGNTVSYTMMCHGTLLESSATYRGSTYEGTLKTTRQGKTTTTSVKAHRLGAC